MVSKTTVLPIMLTITNLFYVTNLYEIYTSSVQNCLSIGVNILML